MPLLEVRGLAAGRDTGVVRGFHLDVEAGEGVAVLGRRGSGTSALAAALAGVEVVAEGTIVLDGKPLDGLAPEERVRRGLVLVPRGGAPLGGLSVEDNLRAGGWVRREDPEFVAGRRRRCLRYLPRLEARLGHEAGTLPPVERLMLGLARGLMTGPRLLLVDEPSWGLSTEELGEVLDAVRDVIGDGVAVVLLDRHVAVLGPALRGVVLREGVTVYNGPASDLRASAALRRDLLWPRPGGWMA